MEFIGAFPEGDWESLGKMFSAEDLDFTPHFVGQCSFNPNNLSHNTTIEGILNLGQSSFFPDDIIASEANTTESLFHSLESLNSNLQYLSQESSYSTSTNSGTQDTYNYFSESCHINNVTNINDHGIVSMPYLLMDHIENNNITGSCNNNMPAFNDNVIMGDQNMCNDLKRMCDSGAEDNDNANAMESSSPNPKKKPRVLRDVQKSKRNGKRQAKQGQNGKSEEEIGNTSSYSSEDENASQENNGDGETSDGKTTTAVNLNGKARASRGSATDPQSLYARKRRERINERLRILQNLVPNGTKVDISTMLEEAVHYVKFLQLQIKLLSSDDMWMYAPIAYNGMDIGLSEKLSQLV